MMKSIAWALMGAVIVGGAANAHAAKKLQKPAKRTPEMIFQALDANKDGKIEIKEYLKLAKGKSEIDMATKRFKKMDANEDGSVDLAEFKNATNPPKKPKKK